MFFLGGALGLFWALALIRPRAEAAVAWILFMVAAVAYARLIAVVDLSYDALAHVSYVRFIADHHILPNAADCWVCYHPPLYYVVAAGFYRVLVSCAAHSAVEGLQYLSTALFGLYLLASFKIVEENVPDEHGRTFAYAVLVLIPANLLHSARVGNDAMIFPLWAGALLFTARWERDGGGRRLVAAAVLLAAGCFTKITAVVAASAVAATVTTTWTRFPERRAEIRRDAMAAAAIFSVGLALYVAWSRDFLFDAGVSANYRDLLEGFPATHTWWRQITIQPWTFLTQTVTSPDNRDARRFFWNYFLKTALVGEWDFSHPGARATLFALAGSFLAFLGVFAILAVRARSAWRKMPSVFVWSLVLSPLFSFAHWYRTEVSPSADARYVFPVWVAVVVVYVRLAEEAREKGLRAPAAIAPWALYALAASAAAWHVAFWLSLVTAA